MLHLVRAQVPLQCVPRLLPSAPPAGPHAQRRKGIRVGRSARSIPPTRFQPVPRATRTPRKCERCAFKRHSLSPPCRTLIVRFASNASLCSEREGWREGALVHCGGSVFFRRTHFTSNLLLNQHFAARWWWLHHLCPFVYIRLLPLLQQL
jgi:hypothetical protein